MALCFALMHSRHRAIVKDATNLMKSKLPTVSSLSDLPSDIAHSIVYFVSTSKEEVCSADVVSKLQRISQQDGTGASSGSSQRPVASSSKPSISLSKSLRDFGYQCSSSTSTLRRTVYTDIGFGSLDEGNVADILFMCIPHENSNNSGNNSAESALLYSLLHDSPRPEGGQQMQWWNVDSICTMVSEDCRDHLNWSDVVRQLDKASNLFRPNENEFNLLCKYFARMSGRPLQMAGLMNAWENQIFQLSLLVHATKAPRNLVDFSELVSTKSRFSQSGPEGEIPAPPNLSWMCPSLYSILLAIAGRGLSSDVVQILIDAAQRYPEYVLLGLAQVNEQASGARTEVLRLILNRFSGLSGSRPSSDAVMSKLFEINQDLLVLLCRNRFKERTVASRNCHHR